MITVQLEVPIFFSGSDIRHTKEGVRTVLATFLTSDELAQWHWTVFKPVDQEPVGVFLTVKDYPRGLRDHLQEVSDHLIQGMRGLHRDLPIAVTVEFPDPERRVLKYFAKIRQN